MLSRAWNDTLDKMNILWLFVEAVNAEYTLRNFFVEHRDCEVVVLMGNQAPQWFSNISKASHLQTLTWTF